MPRVDFTERNINRCRCGECPVQADSKCAKEQYEQSQKAQGLPRPEEVPGVYCSSGKANCNDLDFSRNCLCPQCQVWAEYGLGAMYYCSQGNAEQVG